MNGDSPQSWRDVYQLVRDTRTDILTAVTESHQEAMSAVKTVDLRVTGVDTRLIHIETERASEAARVEVSRGVEAAKVRREKIISDRLIRGAGKLAGFAAGLATAAAGAVALHVWH